MIDTPHGEILFDYKDLPLVSIYGWRVHSSSGLSYARADADDGPSRYRLMHRLILGITDPSIHVDHVSRDGLDNRRANLRIATRAENMRNRKTWGRHSRFHGVSKDKNSHRFQVQVNGQVVARGNTGDEIIAAMIRDRYAKLYHGEFAALNFRDEKDLPSGYEGVWEDIQAGRESRYATVTRKSEMDFPLTRN